MESNGSDLLTSSRLKAARSCLRLHQLRYIEGYRSVEEAQVLRFGSLIHKALEAWWLAHEGRLEAALAALAGESDVDPFDRVRAEEMIRGYDCRWANEPYEVIAVEQQFEMDLVNPTTGASSRTWRLGGKIDAIVKDLTGATRKLLIEHKSSAEDISPGSSYWQKLKMDGQLSIYFQGATSIGHPVDGCLYDVLGKPGIKPYKATPEEDRKYTQAKYKQCPECRKKNAPPAPHEVDLDGRKVSCEPDPEGGPRRVCSDPGGKLYANLRDSDETTEEFRLRLREDIATNPAKYFQRGEVVRLESEITDAMLDTWQLGQMIRETHNAGRYPRNPDACFQFHRPCEFFGVCCGQSSLDDPQAFRRISHVHPEITGQDSLWPKEAALS